MTARHWWRFTSRVLVLALAHASIVRLGAQPLGLAPDQDPDAFPLVRDGAAAPLIVEAGTDPAVVRAAGDLCSDTAGVTGVTPALERRLPDSAGAVVLAGVAGSSPAIDRLAAAGAIDLRPLTGAWETYVVQAVSRPFPGVDRALVIAGSDRRGAIFGIYELSAAIGVSPWQWWADVPPRKRTSLLIPAGTHRFGPPSVRYRGIFLNDEDWGLEPWAARTFEPESGGIGPKTYARVFELLLRLKANTLWPAMHPGTKPFNAFPGNKRLADAYGIVMGSSHAEPMLRDNVGEWTAAPDTYNYRTNREGVLRYWEQRVAENGHCENIYTLGMRGIHDSVMVGPATDPERIRTLERIFADQRALIAKHVDPDVARVPQMFCPYKEVLGLYRAGLKVPDDVTIVWSDDNFGYVRDFAAPAERARPGGFGVYYHLSYLGRPLAYLWLCTTPPALVWEELGRAYAHGADCIWIANVGDLKPAEIATEFFLEMAWDVRRWQPGNLADFLPAWAARTFGPGDAAEIGAILDEYYRLNFQRKPEHLQWWLPGAPPRPSALTDAEVQDRLDAFAGLRRRVDALRARMPAPQQDAFYELVYYPVVGSALANERFFEGERGQRAAAESADARLAAETRYFNDGLRGGKWREIMALEPADAQWSSMRPARWAPPAAARAAVPSPAPGTFLAFDAADFSANTPSPGGAWTVIPGLGRTGRAVTVLPAGIAPIGSGAAAPRLDYAVTFPAAGSFALQVHLLPTHPTAGRTLRFAVALDDAPPRPVTLDDADAGPDWARGVLDGVRIATTRLTVDRPGAHTLHVAGIDPGVVLDRFVIDLGGLTPTYLGPP